MRDPRKIYAGNTKATPLPLTPSYCPQKPYPYFLAKIRYELGPKVVEVESPYRGWPRMTLEHGILV